MTDWKTLQTAAGVVASCFALLGLGGCVVIGAYQRKLMYFPYHGSEPDLLALARQEGCEPWRDASGAVIGWKSARHGEHAQNRLVVFHGNAGFALHRGHYIAGFEGIDGGKKWEVYVMEYPGYGARPGAVGEGAFVKAGLAALDALEAGDSRPIFVLGESIGSGVACAVAARAADRVAGIFLVTPFARMTDVAAMHFKLLPVNLLLRDRWNNVAALRHYRGPLAMLVAGDDEVVSEAQGKLLFSGYEGPKRLWVQEGAGHNSVDFHAGAPWWREVSEFLLREASPRLSPQ